MNSHTARCKAQACMEDTLGRTVRARWGPSNSPNVEARQKGPCPGLDTRHSRRAAGSPQPLYPGIALGTQTGHRSGASTAEAAPGRRPMPPNCTCGCLRRRRVRRGMKMRAHAVRPQRRARRLLARPLSRTPHTAALMMIPACLVSRRAPSAGAPSAGAPIREGRTRSCNAQGARPSRARSLAGHGPGAAVCGPEMPQLFTVLVLIFRLFVFFVPF